MPRFFVLLQDCQFYACITPVLDEPSGTWRALSYKGRGMQMRPAKNCLELVLRTAGTLLVLEIGLVEVSLTDGHE